MQKQLSRAKSLFFIHLSNILFAAAALFVSMVSGNHDGYFTTFCRFAVGLIIGFSSLGATRTPFRIVRFKPWIGRGVFGSLAMTLFYVSIAHGTPGRASLFNNSFPIFVAIIAILFLGDKVRKTTIAGVLVGFAGVAVVLWDGGQANLFADAIGLASGFFAGISYHFNKKASQTEHPVVIYLGVCFVGLAITAFSAPQLVSLDVHDAIILVLAALAAYYAQIAITIGLRDLPITEGSIHTFAKIPLTILAGWLFLGDRITAKFLIGTALLIGGILLEQVTHKKEPNK
jgi:drug/metabolite transporter (DMT)-like permease